MSDLHTLWHQAAAHPPDEQRRRSIARIRQLWRTERDAGQRNPPPELSTDLDVLTLEELEQLGRAVRRRVDAVYAKLLQTNAVVSRTDLGSAYAIHKSDMDAAARWGDMVSTAGAETQPPAQLGSWHNVEELPSLPDGWHWCGLYQAAHATYGKTSTYHDVRYLLKDIRKRQPKPPKRDAPPEPRVQGELFSA